MLEVELATRLDPSNGGGTTPGRSMQWKTVDATVQTIWQDLPHTDIECVAILQKVTACTYTSLLVVYVPYNSAS